MPRIFSNGKKIYSVDMMFTYVNTNNCQITKIDINDLKHVLDFDGWGDEHVKFSPNDVIANPLRYKKEMELINNADLSYPIITTYYKNRLIIVDGVHRLVKSLLLGKKQIKAYIFNDDLMKKFLIKN